MFQLSAILQVFFSAFSSRTNIFTVKNNNDTQFGHGKFIATQVLYVLYRRITDYQPYRSIIAPVYYRAAIIIFIPMPVTVRSRFGTCSAILRKFWPLPIHPSSRLNIGDKKTYGYHKRFSRVSGRIPQTCPSRNTHRERSPLAKSIDTRYTLSSIYFVLPFSYSSGPLYKVKRNRRCRFKR